MDETHEVRRCGRCKVMKPISEFRRKRNGRFQSYCNPCHAEWARAYYLEHREQYIQRALDYKQKLKAIRLEAKDRPCADCGIKYASYVMDFDHREGEEKLFNVSSLNQHRWVSIRQLKTEIAKCDVVCANCHREREHLRRCKKAVRKKG